MNKILHIFIFFCIFSFSNVFIDEKEIDIIEVYIFDKRYDFNVFRPFINPNNGKNNIFFSKEYQNGLFDYKLTVFKKFDDVSEKYPLKVCSDYSTFPLPYYNNDSNNISFNSSKRISYSLNSISLTRNDPFRVINNVVHTNPTYVEDLETLKNREILYTNVYLDDNRIILDDEYAKKLYGYKPWSFSKWYSNNNNHLPKSILYLSKYSDIDGSVESIEKIYDNNDFFISILNSKGVIKNNILYTVVKRHNDSKYETGILMYNFLNKKTNTLFAKKHFNTPNADLLAIKDHLFLTFSEKDNLKFTDVPLLASKTEITNSNILLKNRFKNVYIGEIDSKDIVIFLERNDDNFKFLVTEFKNDNFVLLDSFFIDVASNGFDIEYSKEDEEFLILFTKYNKLSLIKIPIYLIIKNNVSNQVTDKLTLNKIYNKYMTLQNEIIKESVKNINLEDNNMKIANIKYNFNFDIKNTKLYNYVNLNFNVYNKEKNRIFINSNFGNFTTNYFFSTSLNYDLKLKNTNIITGLGYEFDNINNYDKDIKFTNFGHFLLSNLYFDHSLIIDKSTYSKIFIKNNFKIGKYQNSNLKDVYDRNVSYENDLSIGNSLEIGNIFSKTLNKTYKFSLLTSLNISNSYVANKYNNKFVKNNDFDLDLKLKVINNINIKNHNLDINFNYMYNPFKFTHLIGFDAQYYY